MFGIPEKYHIGLVTDKSRYPLSHLSYTDKKRFRHDLKNLVLEFVVKDDYIPAFICETNTVKAVQFFSARVDSIRSSPFICGTLQRMTKTPCVIRIEDEREERISFALKRLNFQDNQSIIIVDEFLTSIQPRGVLGMQEHLIDEYLAWDSIVNKTDLHSWYLEMMVKCYIINHRDYWTEMLNLLPSTVWYNSDDVISMYNSIKYLVKITKERRNSNTIGDSALLNTQLRSIYEKLKSYFSSNEVYE